MPRHSREKSRAILIDGGYVTFSGTAPYYHYYLKDHLGSNRVVVSPAGTAEQINHYYPFGGLFGESTSGSTQRFKFNGKEFDRTHGVDWYDYGARHMSPDAGRFTTIDPMAEKYYNTSPYAYCVNNPIKYVDPDGRDYEINVDSVNHNITISATYYALSNSYESAKHAVDIINQQSGNFSYEVDGISYSVSFNLNAIDIGSNDIADLNIAYINDPTEYANTYQVVSDDIKRMDSNTNGKTFGGKDIMVKKSRSMTETGAHEIGHTLGLLHNEFGLMTSESSSYNRGESLLKNDIKEMIIYPIKGKRNAGAGEGHLRYQMNRNFIKGRVSKRRVK